MKSKTIEFLKTKNYLSIKSLGKGSFSKVYTKNYLRIININLGNISIKC